MKKIILIPLLICIQFCNGQITDQKHILTFMIGNFYVGGFDTKIVQPGIPTSTTNQYTFSLETLLTYGKVHNNHLISYGIDLAGSIAKQNGASKAQHMTTIAPLISYEKFYPVVNRIYYSPLLDFRVGYFHNTDGFRQQKSYYSIVNFSPFSITFCKNERTFFIFKIGILTMQYAHSKSYDQGSADQYSTYNTYSLSGSVNQFNIGIQRAF